MLGLTTRLVGNGSFVLERLDLLMNGGEWDFHGFINDYQLDLFRIWFLEVGSLWIFKIVININFISN